MRTKKLAAGICLWFSAQAGASQFLVVTRSSTGTWTLQAVESISLGGKDKVRRILPGGQETKTWDSKTIGRAPAVDLETLAIIRRGPDGVMLGRSSQYPDWLTLLPDGVKPKVAETPAALWKQTAISVRADRKDKSDSAIAGDELYAILPGTDAPAMAGTLATNFSLHKVPGMTDGEAFLYATSMIPATMKAFPSGPAAEKLREHARASMASALQKWSDGDAEAVTLNEALAMAAASDAAFPTDGAQTELRAQARAAKQKLDRQTAILRTLHAGGLSDAFLLAYRDFELFDRSFKDLSDARQSHLKKSALSHMETASRLHNSGDYAQAIRHLRIAVWRDPKLAAADQLLERVRLEVARITSQRIAEQRRGIDARSPAQVQLHRRLTLAEQCLRDNKLDETEEALKSAEAVDKDEPKIRYLEARLAVLRGDLARALALLDFYAGLATTQGDFEEGERLRAEVVYKIDDLRKGARTKLAGNTSAGMFAVALEVASDSLKVDNEDSQFLYQAGLNSCVLRNCDHASPLLRRFLDITDSTQGKRDQRLVAVRLLRQGAGTNSIPKTPVAGETTSWFSGAPLDKSVLYDPISLAFQAKVAKVEGSKSLTVSYEWAGSQLKSVHTRYEDKKTGTNILKVVAAAAGSAGGIGSTVGWRTADRETNDFFFNYYDDFPQVLKVSRDQTVVKSRTIRVPIPGVGMFGPMAALGGLGGLGGGLGGLRGLAGSGGVGGMTGNLASMTGFAGVSGFGGVGGTGALRALSAAQTPNFSAGTLAMTGLTAARQFNRSDSYAIRSDPQGGQTSGFVTLWNSPRIDTQIAQMANGKKAATGFSGNAFFHPFVWDALHLFELDYDEQGRVRRAHEVDVPGAPELEFTWDGKRLTAVKAKGGGYSRTLHYAGDRLTHEVVSFGGKQSKIEYKYDKQGALLSAECDEDLSLDGRSRRVEFIKEFAKAGGKK